MSVLLGSVLNSHMNFIFSFVCVYFGVVASVPYLIFNCVFYGVLILLVYILSSHSDSRGLFFVLCVCVF